MAQHAKGKGAPGETKTLCANRKARYDYHIEETYEVGIVLLGSEVKSIRQGQANLRDSYAAVVLRDVVDSVDSPLCCAHWPVCHCGEA